MNVTQKSLRIKFYPLVFAVLSLLLTLAASVPAAEIKPKRIVTENGITLLILERPSLPIVSVTALVRAGSLYDPNNKAGLANLTTSLLDEGTKKRTSTQIADAVDFIGADLSASANEDYMTATLHLLKKDADTGFDLLSDILINPVFDPKEVERVRKSILGTLISEKDQPQAVASRAFRGIVFGEHPYRNPVIGGEETVPNITREEIVSFHRSYFVPNNLILSIVGDVTEKEAVALTKKYFGKWERKQIVFPRVGPPTPFQGKKLELIDKELTQASVMLGHVGIDRANPDYYAVTVMNYILGGGGFSSRMMADIRDNKGLVYSIYSYFEANRYPGEFAVSLQTRSKSTNEAIEGVVQEIARIRKEPVVDRELAEAKAYLVGSFPLRMETTARLAALLASIEYYQLGLDYFEKYPSYINRVTREDVLRVAQKYLDPDHYALVVVAKQSDAQIKELPTATEPTAKPSAAPGAIK
ncbi:MAG: insulinase family protein [Nitrospirae bacterium]|nr:insulinase family protein [Candidatus Manganitrophaceae bacterium]